VLAAFQSYLGTRSEGRIGAQHVLDAEYFRRIEALNFTLAHDDGQHVETLQEADVLLVGVSRTSKTPTAIYLANRGVKAANFPLVPGAPIPPELLGAAKPLVVGLIASPDRIVQVRQHRVLAMKSEEITESYVDRDSVTEEVAWSRKLCARQAWPIIDVTRRSIEETAAAIIGLLAARKSAGIWSLHPAARRGSPYWRTPGWSSKSCRPISMSARQNNRCVTPARRRTTWRWRLPWQRPPASAIGAPAIS
jgi:regulator of PEP synthase PpsR (kinase-PPPase family)